MSSSYTDTSITRRDKDPDSWSVRCDSSGIPGEPLKSLQRELTCRETSDVNLYYDLTFNTGVTRSKTY